MTIVASHAEMALRWPAVVARAEAAIAVFAADERRLACRHVLDGSLSFTLCAEHPSGGVRGEDAPSKYKLTDVGNAARLVDAHGHDFRYVAGWGTWLVWDGRRWKRDGTGKVVEAAKAVARDLWREVASESDAAKRKELARWAGQNDGANRIDAMVRLARSAPEVAGEPEELDSHPWPFKWPTGPSISAFRRAVSGRTDVRIS